MGRVMASMIERFLPSLKFGTHSTSFSIAGIPLLFSGRAPARRGCPNRLSLMRQSL
jgi:hypothetical protein